MDDKNLSPLTRLALKVGLDVPDYLGSTFIEGAKYEVYYASHKDVFQILNKPLPKRGVYLVFEEDQSVKYFASTKRQARLLFRIRQMLIPYGLD